MQRQVLIDQGLLFHSGTFYIEILREWATRLFNYRTGMNYAGVNGEKNIEQLTNQQYSYSPPLDKLQGRNTSPLKLQTRI